MKTYDAIIIGFGKGGKTLAAEFAKRGKKVAVIERSEKMYGGTCINIGCIPTKTLVHQAKIATERNHTTFHEKNAFFRQSVASKDSVVHTLREKNYHNLADNLNITLYTGIGSFVDEDTVRIQTTNGDFLIKSDQIIINTGAETIIPAIEGIENNPFVHNSTSIMDLNELPERLIIVGGGYIGLEFASLFASFGSEVIILESYDDIIPREDRDVAASVKETLQKKGIRFKMNAKVKSVSQNNGVAIVTYLDSAQNKIELLEANAILIATGRKANTELLNLEAASIKTDERGAIIVDEYLKTTNPKVRAVGDVKGGLQFTYISLDDYRIIREDLFGSSDRKTTDRDPVSYSVFIDPPLSRIGINETDAKRLGLDVSIKKIPVSAIPRAKTLGESDGLLKAVIDNDTHQILGCVLFAPESGEVINIVAMAMKLGLPSDYLKDFIFTHPSMSEALNDLFA